jgi:hypothetical protein
MRVSRQGMSVLSVTCCTLFSAVFAFTLVSSSGCGTNAVGVDQCRDIEEARCTGALSCGIITDVDTCKRFYRDQCLHGLAVASPGTAAVSACVATINAAGVCAMADAGTPLKECGTVSASAPGAKTACDIISSPELAAECAFLVPGADAGTAAGGTSGTSGAAGEGGSSGMEEASGASGAAGG